MNEGFSYAYFLEGRLLATTGGEASPTGHERNHRLSYAWMCPICGEIWLRAVSDAPNTEWMALHIPCPEHGRPEVLLPSALRRENPLTTIPRELIKLHFKLMEI